MHKCLVGVSFGFITFVGDRILGSPPLYSLLPLWAGDAKEGQLTKMLCPEFDGKSSCPLKGKY